MHSPVTVDRARFDAVIFDLDGVISSTQRLHAAAWKDVFDEVVGQESSNAAQSIEPFRIDPDYYLYVDGKPRYDGVRSFLEARGIDLPEGRPDDAPEARTVHGIGNRKNQLFRELLASQGAEAYPAAIELIRALRARGFGIGVVSSSRNCRGVLDSLGAAPLFHCVIDGNEAARLELTGKPAPDIFLVAAQRLMVAPNRTIVVEDAIAGVSAGRAGRFGLVIGVDRRGMAAELAEAGADVVVTSLDRVQVGEACARLPDALDSFSTVRSEIGNHPVAVFLDYDGTLTPIVDRPELAQLAAPMRTALERVARVFPTAVISGRDVEDVRRLVGIGGILYAGSHGLDVLHADGSRSSAEGAERFLADLERAESLLEDRLAGIDGALVERKRFALAAHYRLVAETDVARVEAAVDEALAASSRLRKRGGKKIFELLPDMEWDKGRAVCWLVEQLPARDVVPVYVGDDLTDEDAFHAVRVRGLGIVVTDVPQPSAARYSLDDTDAVREFLQRLAIL
jgi:alpha,alpha-trehalase